MRVIDGRGLGAGTLMPMVYDLDIAVDHARRPRGLECTVEQIQYRIRLGTGAGNQSS